MTLAQHRQLTDLVTGFPLGNYFYVVRPEATVNLIPNPSFERGLGNVSSIGAGTTLAISDAWQARGANALRVEVGAVAPAGFFLSVLNLSAIAYTFSFDIHGNAGHTYRAYIVDGGFVQVGGQRIIKSKGENHLRRAITATLPTAGFYAVVVERIAPAVAETFYVDGLQLEAKPYATTYADGSMRGYRGSLDYYWQGEPHNSPSVRIAQARSGGRIIPLAKFGLYLRSIIGLGLAGNVNHLQAIEGGGEYYGGSVMGGRTFTLNYRLEQPAEKQQVISLVSPYATTPQQPTTLLYAANADEAQGGSGEIMAVYDDGLGGNIETIYAEDLPLSFRIPTPYTIRDTKTEGKALTTFSLLEQANRVIEQTEDGVWRCLGNGLDDSYAFGGAYAQGGELHVVGSYSAASGVPGTAYFSRFNFASMAWEAIATLNNIAPAIKNVPGLGVVVGGDFSTPCTSLFSFNDLTVTCAITASKPLAPYSVGGLFRVVSIIYDRNGRLLFVTTEYTGGLIIAGSRLIRDDGTAFTVLAYDTHVATSVEMGIDGEIYVGLAYTGVSVGGVYKWDGNVGGSLVSVGTWGGTLETINHLSLGPDGKLYACGTNLTSYGTDTNLLCWNGITWLPVATTNTGGSIRRLRWTERGEGLVLGIFSELNGRAIYNNAAIFNGAIFAPYEIEFSAAPFTEVWDAVVQPGRRAMLGAFSGRLRAAGVTALTCSATLRCAPVLRVRGPGRVYTLTNYTNNKRVYFDMVVGTDEYITVDFSGSPGVEVLSSVGGITGQILPGSNYDFYLEQGQNNVSIFILSSGQEFNDNQNLLSGYGNITGLTAANSNDGRLYIDVESSGGQQRARLYADANKTREVARTAYYGSSGVKALIEQNNSGVGGYITSTAANFNLTDSDIEVQLPIASLHWVPTHSSVDAYRNRL